jgi:hypothetical protein
MKAKKVYEFEQGLDPYKTMNIGSRRQFKTADKFECLSDIYFNNIRPNPIWALLKPSIVKHHDDYGNPIETMKKGEIITLKSGPSYEDEDYNESNPIWFARGIPYAFEEDELRKYFRRL